MEMSFSMIKARIAEDQDERRASVRLPVELEAQDARARRQRRRRPDSQHFRDTASWPIADGQFEVGSRVWLMLPGRDRANAVVKWTAGDKLGAEFAEPISLEGLQAG